jgi:uncharacterized membrane protein
MNARTRRDRLLRCARTRDTASARLARSFGRDMPAALIEDVVAIAGGYLIVSSFG